MSDSRAKIAEDEEDYLHLCQKYGERPDPSGPYGPHAAMLERLFNAENKAKKAFVEAESNSLRVLALYRQARAKLSDEEFEALQLLLAK